MSRAGPSRTITFENILVGDVWILSGQSNREFELIMVPQPIHYRYASGRNPLANLQAEANKDLPFATQRSDDWPLHTVPSGILPEDLKPPYAGGDLQKLRLALREMDPQRRLAEARKVIEELEPK